MNSQLMDNYQATGSNWAPIVLGRYESSSQEFPSASDEVPSIAILASLEEQMTLFEREHRLTVAELARLYIFSQEASVKECLRIHRMLPQLLISALPYLQKQFGSIIFSLRVGSGDHDWQILYVDALWAGQATDALTAINSFEDEWWLAASSVAAGSLHFTYRLV